MVVPIPLVTSRWRAENHSTLYSDYSRSSKMMAGRWFSASKNQRIDQTAGRNYRAYTGLLPRDHRTRTTHPGLACCGLPWGSRSNTIAAWTGQTVLPVFGFS